MPGERKGGTSPIPDGGVKYDRTGGRSPTSAHDAQLDSARRRAAADKKHKWAEAFPVRMRRFLAHNTMDVAMRIYCELVVRLPVVGSRTMRDAVMNLVEPFGSCEYIAAVGNKAEAASVSVDVNCAHIVRFREGIDAVRCYLELNGSVIDPAKYNATVEQVAMLLSEHNDTGEERDEDARATHAARLAKELRLDSNRRGDPSALVFVTCDFFRLAFTEAAADGGVVARSTLVSGRATRAGLRPSAESPAEWIARELAVQADEAAHAYPVVVSYDFATWAGFCRAANVCGFMLPTPTPNGYMAMMAKHKAHVAKEDIAARPPTNITVAFEALRRKSNDVDDLLELIDVSTSAEDLIFGPKSRGTGIVQTAARGVLGALQQQPLLAAVVLFFLVCAVTTFSIVAFVHR